MKIIHTILLMLWVQFCFAPEANLQAYEDTYCHTSETIEFIKHHEGFMSVPYNDNGYQAIGYGVRTIYVDTPDSICQNVADSLLWVMWNRNEKYIDTHYPELQHNKKTVLIHLAYSVGIGSILRSKVYSEGKLDSTILFSRFKQHKYIREYEWALWNKKTIKIEKLSICRRK